MKKIINILNKIIIRFKEEIFLNKIKKSRKEIMNGFGNKLNSLNDLK